MSRLVCTPRLIAWIAALAILAGALLPALGQAAARITGDHAWAEICTAYGIERIATDVAPEPDDSSDRAGPSLCLWCQLHATSALPPAAVTELPRPRFTPGIFPRASSVDIPRPQFAATASRPRAPPASL